MRLTPATYFTHSELFQEDRPTIERLRQELAKFRRNETVYACSVFNAVLRDWQGHSDDAAHDALLRDSLPPDVANLVAAACKRSSDIRGFYHRQQLLLVCKETIRVCEQAGRNPLELRYWGGLGLALLMANDLLPKRIVHPTEYRSQLISVIAELIPVGEASGYFRPINKIVRTGLMLWRFLPVNDLSINDAFERATHVSIPVYQALTFAALTRYADLSLEKYRSTPGDFLLLEKWFSTVALSAAEKSAFLNEVSGSAEELRRDIDKPNSPLLDFTVFRKKPVFRDGDVHFVIDPAFLAEKAESGVFWSILAGLEPAQRLPFHSMWGVAFERYINWLISESIDGKRNVLHTNPKFEDNDNEEVCDSIVLCDDSALFIEAKSGIFTAESKYCTNAERLRDEIEEKLVAKRGASQLARSIALVFHKKAPRRVANIDLSRVTKVFPVVITRDDIGSALGINRYLADRFRELLQRRQLRTKVTPVFCLSAQDVELICGFLKEASLADLLEERYRQDPGLLSPFWLVDNRIIERLGDRRCEAFSGAFHDYMRKVEKILDIRPPEG